MQNIYKLKYPSKKALNTDLVSRGIIDIEGTYLEGTHAVVYLGKIVLEKAVFDVDGNEVSPAEYSDKYHADIMVERSLSFPSSNLVVIAEGNTAAHTFG